MNATTHYPNGQITSNLDENGNGFIYYPNGSIAVCISPISEYQSNYYVFDNNKSMTILLAIDCYGIGFAMTTKNHQFPVKHSLTLSDKGGLYAFNSTIQGEWKWKSISSFPLIDFSLNSFLTFKFVNQSEMKVTFKCENMNWSFVAVAVDSYGVWGE